MMGQKNRGLMQIWMCFNLHNTSDVCVSMYVCMQPLSLLHFWKIVLLSQPLPELALPLPLALDDGQPI